MRELRRIILLQLLVLLFAASVFAIVRYILRLPFLFAVLLACLGVILILQWITTRSMNWMRIIATIGLVLTFALNFGSIEQLWSQPELKLDCQELATQYPNPFAPGPVVLYRPNQTYKQIREPILIVLTNNGRSRAVNPRLSLSLSDNRFLISIFGIRRNEEWLSKVKGPISGELLSNQFSWNASKDKRTVALTLSEITPAEILKVYLLLATAGPSKKTEVSLEASINWRNKFTKKEFRIIWNEGEMRCKK